MKQAQFENEQTLLAHRTAGTMDEFHRSFDEAVDAVTETLGRAHPLRIDGESVEADDRFTVTSPGNTDRVVGEFAAGDGDDVSRAVDAAADAFEDWEATHWGDRVDPVRRAADLMADRKYEFGAILSLETGKNRPEAMAEVDEAIDFLRFYARELERNEGYEFDTGEPTPGQRCANSLKPYGVFGVVSPFNFPLAIFTGMTVGAVLAGNTAVVKPASATPLVAHEVLDVLEAAGIPDGVVNLVTGGGSDVGQPLVEHDDVAGVVFTGSRAVGQSIQRTFLDLGKGGPVVAELGGKNPVVVTESADMEKAVSGVAKGAFSFSGQKCSATSRVYVQESVFEEFRDRVANEAEEIPIRPASEEGAFAAPLVDDGALERYRDVCSRAREEGTVHTGGQVVTDGHLGNGRFVEPTVVTGVPHGHELAREEHFLPFVTLHPVSDLDEGIEKSNDSEYGLCAGLFSEDAAEVEEWFDRIESGMCYVNRHQSATTGALVQAQPFGGWKASGTTGKFAGGYWYLPQFMREQSRTVVGDVTRP